MSDTPRTDAMVVYPDDGCSAVVDADTSRELERELAASRAQVERVQALHNGLMADAEKRYDELYGENRELTAQVEALRGALAELVAVHDKIESIGDKHGHIDSPEEMDAYLLAIEEQDAAVEAARTLLATTKESTL